MLALESSTDSVIDSLFQVSDPGLVEVAGFEPTLGFLHASATRIKRSDWWRRKVFVPVFRDLMSTWFSQVHLGPPHTRLCNSIGARGSVFVGGRGGRRVGTYASSRSAHASWRRPCLLISWSLVEMGGVVVESLVDIGRFEISPRNFLSVRNWRAKAFAHTHCQILAGL